MIDYNIDIEIIPHGKVNETLMADLRELHLDLTEANIKTNPSTAVLPGVKADLVLAITIIGLAISSISALISALALWQSRKAKYSVSIPTEYGTYEISNLTKRQALDMATTIRKHGLKAPLVIRISQV